MMKFGTTNFPGEPIRFKVGQARRYQLFVSPFGAQIAPQFLELTPREVKVELWLSGSNAQTEYHNLYTAFAAQQEGLLTLPDGVSFQAFFTGMEKEENAEDHILRITVSFLEKA